MKRLIGLALVAATTLAHAQNTAIPGAPASAAKKDMVQRLLVIQQPGLENMMRDLLERPARQMSADAEEILATRVAPEKRPEAVKKIQELLNKYRDETAPLIRERSAKIGQATLAPIFEEKYTEDELKQLLAALESPAYKKYQQSLPELANAYGQSVLKELEPVVQPKVAALQQGIGSALGATAGAPAPSAAKPAAKPAAPAASKPAKK
ncbi:hypothetical protein LRS03_00665 [Rhizobacter sp. J219]|jgi:hypothetical protein|uniref:hypothetical protein n=1 Tax=Rhizobacter sp. J219 TaxID=2898430 RepID=UPI002150C9C5|nr:hypothetical protein [Rhizobacter sp. J219]MCR5881455.1 hypothetical protein [Rhizobacter sp. J219]